MWATCLATKVRRAAGFTLLELLVVLSILGLATALAAPAILQSTDAWRRGAAVDSLMDQVRGLPMRARALGRPIVIDEETLSGDDAALSVPAGWSLSTPAPWRVQANGACEGGRLLLAGETGNEVELVVEAPFCDVGRAEELQ